MIGSGITAACGRHGAIAGIVINFITRVQRTVPGGLLACATGCVDLGETVMRLGILDRKSVV